MLSDIPASAASIAQSRRERAKSVVPVALLSHIARSPSVRYRTCRRPRASIYLNEESDHECWRLVFRENCGCRIASIHCQTSMMSNAIRK
jgi:hypothetical protein